MRSIPLIIQALVKDEVSFVLVGGFGLQICPKDKVYIEALEKIKRGESPDA